MRYFLPGDAHRADPTVGAVAPVRRAAPGGGWSTGGSPGGPGGTPAGLIVRTVPMPAGEASGYLTQWELGPPAGRRLAIGGPVAAGERIGGGRPRRVQRLAVAVAGPDAIAVHWSAPAPVGEHAEGIWRRILSELEARAG